MSCTYSQRTQLMLPSVLSIDRAHHYDWVTPGKTEINNVRYYIYIYGYICLSGAKCETTDSQ